MGKSEHPICNIRQCNTSMVPTNTSSSYTLCTMTERSNAKMVPEVLELASDADFVLPFDKVILYFNTRKCMYEVRLPITRVMLIQAA